MHRGPQTYLEAAGRLWDATYGELSAAIADEALPRPVREAANATVRIKGEFMLPDAPRTEEGAVTKLSTELAAISGLGVDDLNLIKIAGKKPAFEAPPRQSTFRAPPVQRKRKRPGALRIVLLVTALLLVLEALARAGAPVPSVGGIVDRLGPDEPEVEATPGVQGLGREIDPRFDLVTLLKQGQVAAAPRNSVDESAETKDGKTKNANYANGRLRNQADGKQRNQANGKKRKGTDLVERVASKVTSHASRVARSGSRASSSRRIGTRDDWDWKWKRKR